MLRFRNIEIVSATIISLLAQIIHRYPCNLIARLAAAPPRRKRLASFLRSSVRAFPQNSVRARFCLQFLHRIFLARSLFGIARLRIRLVSTTPRAEARKRSEAGQDTPPLSLLPNPPLSRHPPIMTGASLFSGGERRSWGPFETPFTRRAF